MADEVEKNVKISYWSKEKVQCPVCKKMFAKEELLSGGGRLIAGSLTEELHRLYEPSEKYGKIYPVLYSVGACPHCYCAFFWKDFDQLNSDSDIKELFELDCDERKRSVFEIFPYFELKRERSIIDGAAMYYLALLSYDKLGPSYSPTIKKGIICLRLAWICTELNELCPGRNYDYCSEIFYRKAQFFYEEALNYETEGVESMTEAGNLGPDIDKNYGYDGVIYLISLLEYKYGQKTDMSARYKKLDEKKRSIARIFGLGKSSKAKPGPLLEHSRALYDKLTELLKEANTIDLDIDVDDDE